MWASRKPEPVDCGPIQKSGTGSTPYPMTWWKSFTRLPPSGARTVS